MKYFSLTYPLKLQDYNSYKKIAQKSIMSARLKRLIFPVLLMAGLCFYSVYNKDYDSILIYVLILLLSLTGLAYVNKSNRLSEKTMSAYMKKEITVDFYDDHFVVQNHPDQYSKSFSERHYGFDTVIGVAEAEEHFYFIFKTNNILIIPKRILDEEKLGMIKNLIENLFSKIYRFI